MRVSSRLSFVIPALMILSALSASAAEVEAAKGRQPALLGAEDYAAIFGLDVAKGLKSGGCYSSTTCPSSYGACTNWSTFTACGDAACGYALDCLSCNEWDQCLYGAPGIQQPHHRYRVCLNQQAQPCTEYQTMLFTSMCGC